MIDNYVHTISYACYPYHGDDGANGEVGCRSKFSIVFGSLVMKKYNPSRAILVLVTAMTNPFLISNNGKERLVPSATSIALWTDPLSVPCVWCENSSQAYQKGVTWRSTGTATWLLLGSELGPSQGAALRLLNGENLGEFDDLLFYYLSFFEYIAIMKIILYLYF